MGIRKKLRNRRQISRTTVESQNEDLQEVIRHTGSEEKT